MAEEDFCLKSLYVIHKIKIMEILLHYVSKCSVCITLLSQRFSLVVSVAASVTLVVGFLSLIKRDA